MARKVLFAVAAYAVLALVVVGWGWLLTHPLQGSIEETDDDVSRWFAGQRTSLLDPVADVGTLLGETPVGLAVGAVVAVVAGLALRAFAAVVLVALASAGDGGIYWLGSHADPRDRPPVRILDPGLVPTHSFPSGHVGTAVAVYGGAALLLMLWLRSRDRLGGAGRIVVVVLACLPLFVGVSRLYQGAHHLTDVGTSLVYGTVWLAVLAALLRPGAAQPEPAVSRSAGGHADAPVPHR
jgi:undecaprenyl-diphosphatase